MAIYFGVASFVYILKDLSIDFYMSRDGHIMVYSPDPKYYHEFLINSENKSPSNCGVIIASEIVLQGLFKDYNNPLDAGKSVIDTIRSTCEKKQNGEIGLMHCPIEDDPERRGNITTSVDGEEFNCRLKPLKT